MKILYSIRKEAYINDFRHNTIGGAMAANMKKPMWSGVEPKIHKVIRPGHRISMSRMQKLCLDLEITRYNKGKTSKAETTVSSVKHVGR